MSRLKYEKFKVTFNRKLSKGLTFLLDGFVSSFYNYKYKRRMKKVANTSVNRAVKITANAIVRSLVQYSTKTKVIVIAEYASSDYGLETFTLWSPIGKFKNYFEEAVYKEYIFRNYDNQFKVIKYLEEQKGVLVVESELTISPWEARGVKGIYEVSLE